MTGGMSSGIIDKPNIIDTSNLSRGILTHTVQSGDTLATIVTTLCRSTPKTCGLTPTQVRWSNNMRNETLTEGQTLYLPPVPGILYTIKADDTLESIAETYQSNLNFITTLNDMETSGLVVGQTIILPDGVLPERERPEWVPPTPRPPANFHLVDSGARNNIREIGSRAYWIGIASHPGNRSVRGQCTWYAWYWRYEIGRSLPHEVIGNARDWAARLGARGFLVNSTPAYGAVVQTRTSGWGHVGVVTRVVEGEYITIREMNWNFQSFRVFESEVNWEDAIRWRYIH
jgi:surface antigen